jgi:hypothetical protein
MLDPQEPAGVEQMVVQETHDPLLQNSPEPHVLTTVQEPPQLSVP